MSTSNAPRSVVSSLLPVLILAVLAALVVVWALRPGPSLDRELIEHGQVLGSMTGLSSPVTNKLADEYVDANGDLIADAPTGDAVLDPSEILFSYIANDDNPGYEANFKPLADALAKATGKTVRYLPLTDLDQQLAALHDGSLHVCALNTGAVPVAVDAAGFVPVATLGSVSGPSTYQLKLISSKRSNVTDMDHIAGSEITLTEMGANSGFKAPLVLLHQKFGLMPGRDYAIRYSGGYDKSIAGLAKGTYDIIAVASDVLARAERAGDISPTDYQVLFTSEPFPTACFGYSHKLKPELAKQVAGVLSSFGFSGTSLGAVFEASSQTQLVPLNYASDFKLVRSIDDSIGFAHKLRKPQPPEPASEPTTAPAQ